MATDSDAWRRRLIAACDRTLDDLTRQGDPRFVEMLTEIEQLRDRLHGEASAAGGRAREAGPHAADDPRAPDDPAA